MRLIARAARDGAAETRRAAAGEEPRARAEPAALVAGGGEGTRDTDSGMPSRYYIVIIYISSV